MKRKVTKQQLAIIADFIQIPFETLEMLYEKQFLNNSRLLELWNNALYRKGIAKQKITHKW